MAEKLDYKAIAKQAIEMSKASQGAQNALSQKPATVQLTEMLMGLMPDLYKGQDPNAVMQQMQQKALELKQKPAMELDPVAGTYGGEMAPVQGSVRGELDPIQTRQVTLDPVVEGQNVLPDKKTGGNVPMPKDLDNVRVQWKNMFGTKPLSKESKAVLLEMMQNHPEADPNEGMAPTEHPEEYIPGVKGRRAIPSTQADVDSPETST